MTRQKTPLAYLETLPSFVESGISPSFLHEELPRLGISSVEDFLGLVREIPGAVPAETQGLADLYAEALERLVPPENLDLLEPVPRLPSFGVTPPEMRAALDDRLAWRGAEEEAGAPGPFAVEALPTSVSLLDACDPGRRDQGARQTCTAFATAGVLEYLLCRSNGQRKDLSEQFLYWSMAQNGLLIGETSHLAVVFELVRNAGVCQEHLWPYEPDHRPGDITHGNPPDRQASEQDTIQNMFDAVRFVNNPQDVASLRQLLAAGVPVAVEIPLFANYWISSLYYSGQITLPPAGVSVADHHAIILVGYETSPQDPSKDVFLVRNSSSLWGRDTLRGAGYGTIVSEYLASFIESAWFGTV